MRSPAHPAKAAPRGDPERSGNQRLLGHGDLKLLLLALVEQQPGHGYELIRRIAGMFHGHYTPSPGAIYPTLTMLEELGLLQVEHEHGGRKLYAATAAGRRFLADNRDAVDAMTLRTRHAARTAAKMALPPAVRHAMHAVKHALVARGTAWNASEAKRVAALLEHAASEIAAEPDD
ncbi:PadR family transcriptional regulator [Dyella sp. EPa41]|uniref:PadR family transcriptional regulator n=1 Tax=Dyella sp. EPa41 TaxID=1561194 RepID=UPI001916A549|nr:PadR family transcriptional regulator [Dyella sp. EPa41]